MKAPKFEHGKYYLVKRVPRRFQHLEMHEDGRPRQQVKLPLGTDSLAEARARLPEVEARKMAEWAARAEGRDADARAEHLAMRRIANARGFEYRGIDALAADLPDLVRRVMSLVDKNGTDAPPEVRRAVLGGSQEVMPDLMEVMNAYFRLTTDRHANKADHQVASWRRRRERAVAHFVQAIGRNPPVNEIDRPMALEFRAWCQARVAEGQAIDTQNKDIGALSDILSTWSSLTGADLVNPFQGLRLSGRDVSERASYSAAFLRERLIPGLDGLNPEGRAVLLVMVNTGIRPSELLNAPRAALALDHAIPHLRIAEVRGGRVLKQRHTARDIPLLGVSLEAARHLAGAEAWLPRYGMKGDSFSAAANKYLAERGLRPTPQHTVYSIRHGFEDRMLEAGIDDRVRSDIMGQKYDRPRYGTGGALAGRLAALEKVAIR